MNKEKLALQVKALLNEYEYREEENYPYTSSGIDKILSTWEENKSLLIKGFENHPAYNS